MKAFVYLILILTAFQLASSAQSCLPDGIVFESQSQVDNFQANYPGCRVIEGDVTIGLPGGSDISSLAGLSVLEVITGQLLISQNPNLTDLAGFDNLTMIMQAVYINQNQSLESLSGLENLILIGGMFALTNNSSLTSLDGLNNLASIDQDLLIQDNSQLGNLSALRKLVNLGGNLQIEGNTVLSTCEAHGICVYLANSTGSVIIANNAAGCNSQAEVETACANSSVNESAPYGTVIIYPNPAENEFYISINLEKPGKVLFNVLDGTSRTVASMQKEFDHGGEYQITWNAESLPAGIYYYQVILSDLPALISGKLMVVKH